MTENSEPADPQEVPAVGYAPACRDTQPGCGDAPADPQEVPAVGSIPAHRDTRTGCGDAPAEHLFTRLSDAGRELVPVVYRVLPASPTSEATVMRLVESRPYRSKGYACMPFHKPISKCCTADEPRDDE